MTPKLREERLDQLLSGNFDMHGRRIINAGKSEDSRDYVTLEEFNELKKRLEILEKILVR